MLDALYSTLGIQPERHFRMQNKKSRVLSFSGCLILNRRHFSYLSALSGTPFFYYLRPSHFLNHNFSACPTHWPLWHHNRCFSKTPLVLKAKYPHPQPSVLLHPESSMTNAVVLIDLLPAHIAPSFFFPL